MKEATDGGNRATHMAGVLFLAGIVMIGSGLFIILAKEYQETMRTLSTQAPTLAAVSGGTVMTAPLGTTRLPGVITNLTQTAIGVGAFLCILGLVICTTAFYIATFAP